MTQNDILTLAKAGFNAQQIAALNKVGSQQGQPVNNDPYMLTSPARATASPVNYGVPNNNTLDTLTAQVEALTQSVQSNAILGTAQPLPQSADDILAEIINPPGVMTNINGGGEIK